MKSGLLTVVLAVALIAPINPVWADAPYQHDDHHQDHGDRHDEHHADRRDDHGPMPHRDWHNGDRLPDAYRGHGYVISDWRGHHLHRPPHGYHWVQVNGDYVLVAITTGIIASILAAAAAH